eukprot:TRINITY_DN8975_c0_g1_i1.p1 TRINITY_DN8975_c0_g1~~TRINITY_DN8975_c0_g1_i1.p1  ORF type:complete len:138 (-),score=19.90 TRINITY_DN8975_c0_g1_i1:77-490(-)
MTWVVILLVLGASAATTTFELGFEGPQANQCPHPSFTRKHVCTTCTNTIEAANFAMTQIPADQRSQKHVFNGGNPYLAENGSDGYVYCKSSRSQTWLCVPSLVGTQVISYNCEDYGMCWSYHWTEDGYGGHLWEVHC